MRSSVPAALLAFAAAVLPGAPGTAQQLPLAPVRGAGEGVTPAFEGWYDKGDGTYVIYFGYYNRNADEDLDIPLGESNFIEPRELDGAQPTHFEAGRDWGVFGVEVPSTFPTDGQVTWTLVVEGKTYRIPGHLRVDWMTDALGGGAAGNSPPLLKLGDVEGGGPGGVRAATAVRATVGQPVELRIGARDVPNSGGAADLAGAVAAGAAGGRGGRGGAAQVTLAWFKHQGPGGVTFSPETGRVPAAGGDGITMATFDTPGDYVIRVRATDAGIAQAGHAQCCWTNGFVRVTVTR